MVLAVLIRGGGGTRAGVVIVQGDGDAGEAGFVAIARAIAVEIIEDRAGDGGEQPPDFQRFGDDRAEKF
jgi:hypothetical protein